MNKITPFYRQTTFYLLVLAFVLAIIAFTFYVLNCPSEFNGGVVSPKVLTADIVAIVFMVMALIANVIESFLSRKPQMMDILSYKRFLIYGSFVALLYSFSMSILAEYSLIGTVLYPIVSGTVGDPVDPVLLNSYLIKLIGTLTATILSIIIALIMKSRFYKAQNTMKPTLNGNQDKGRLV